MDRGLTLDLTVFASGSTGNCCLVRHGGDGVLIDAGISARRIAAGLAEIGMGPADLTAILITHEHADHIAGLRVFLRKTSATVYAPELVVSALCRELPEHADRFGVFPMETPCVLGPFEVLAFPTPHDTPQSAGYRVTAEGMTIAAATDTGCVTEAMRRYLSGADIALIEANHDIDMLRLGRYPASLKRRILSDRGHLSNVACAELALELAQSGTRRIVLGHLSRENNTPAVALRAVRNALAETEASVYAAPEAGCLTVEVLPCCV